MHHNCAQQPRDIVVIDEEDPVEAVQPSQYHPESGDPCMSYVGIIGLECISRSLKVLELTVTRNSTAARCPATP